MPNPQYLKSHWRKLVDSLKEASEGRMIPEYYDHEDRSRNHRYYR
jgi:hypothetical protein